MNSTNFTTRANIVRSFVSPMVMALALFGASTQARAVEQKIATVDMQKAIETVEAGKSARAQLEKEIAAKQKEFQTEESALRKMDEELKKQSLALSKEAAAKKQSEFQERVMKYQESRARTQMDLQKKEQELTTPIVSRLKEIVAEMAKQRGFSLVLLKNDATVLYSQDQYDLTQDVIAAYNKKS